MLPTGMAFVVRTSLPVAFTDRCHYSTVYAVAATYHNTPLVLLLYFDITDTFFVMILVSCRWRT